jgi:hypothetical protein
MSPPPGESVAPKRGIALGVITTFRYSMSRAPAGQPLFSTAFKLVAGALTVLGTVATIFTTARQEGMIGPLSIYASPVAFIRITPSTDTAWSLGDTLHYAVTASDTNGMALVAPELTWSAANAEVATVRPDGSVIATAAGETSLIVSAGRTIGRAKIVVHPRTVLLRPASDTIELPEGQSTSLIAVPFDAKGAIIRTALARWTISDTTVASVDSLGLATGLTPGIARATARLDGAETRMVVRVTPVLGGLAVAHGSGQHARAGTPLPAAVVVRSLSRQRQPIAGILLRAVAEEGRFEQDTATTDREGNARFTWILGDRPGPQRATFHADGIDSTATVGAEADPAPGNVRFTFVDSIGTAPAGGTLPDPLVLRLTDTLGEVLPDVPVRWIGQDGSRLVASGPRTDSLGQVSAQWTLGPRVGVNRARVVAGPGEAPAHPFSTRSLAGPPAAITLLAGDKQRLPVMRTITVRARLADRSGNLIAGTTLQVEPSAGTVTTIPATAANGEVRFRWTLGPTAGEQRLLLRAGSATARVTATALPAPAAKVEIVAPGISIVSSNSIRVVSAVTDSLGNPVAGVVVQFSVGAGSLNTRRATTDAQGRASTTWTLARRQGDQVITVHATGVRVDATKTVRRPAPR